MKISEVQVNCKNLSEEQINNLVKVFEDNGVRKHTGSYDRTLVKEGCNFIMQTDFDGTHWFSNKDSKLQELSYEEFMEEFSPSFNEVLDLDREIFETENKLKVLKQKKSEQEIVVVSFRQGDKITLKKTTKRQSLNLINNGWKVFSEDDLKDF